MLQSLAQPVQRRVKKHICNVGEVVYTNHENVKVYATPHLGADVVCILLSRVYIRISEIYDKQDKADKSGRMLIWLKADCGWILASDGSEIPFVTLVTNMETATTFWQQEENKKARMASAIASMLVRSYSLPRCIRLARSIMKHATTYYPDTHLTKITHEIMENIMIILGGQSAPTKQQVFEYVKAAAARTSNPKQSVLDISQGIFDTISKRPSLWVTEDLNVIITEDAQRQIDRFVMAAAEGNTVDFQMYLDNNVELTSLHSQLHYTALHAAAEFGKTEIIAQLLTTGLSLDIKDPTRGQTALHFAAYAGREEVALQLLEAGANREITCRQGILPFQAADKQGHVDCREILKFRPPPMTTLSTKDVTITSVSLSWEAPVLNRFFYAKVLDYEVACQCTEELHPDTQQLIGEPLPVRTSLLRCTFANLVSACGYRCRIRARSVSGWSDWSEWVSNTTLAYIPDPPASPEVRKVSVNALYLNWYRPTRCNGSEIDSYEIELCDEATVLQQQLKVTAASIASEENANETNTMVDKSKGDNKGQTPSRKSNSLVAENGGTSRLHRVVKHKNLRHLFKCLTGLEAGRRYQLRLRAHNALGFSHWSVWSPSVAPQVGITIAGFINAEQAVHLTWFAPILSAQHTVEAYELQMCKVTGPRAVTLEAQAYHAQHHPQLREEISAPKKPLIDDEDDPDYYYRKLFGTSRSAAGSADSNDDHHDNNASMNAKKSSGLQPAAAVATVDGVPVVEAGGMTEDFHTLSSTITTNAYTVRGLKAGGRYVCRVRVKLAEEDSWMDWVQALRSDNFATPSSAPDPPLRVRPRRVATSAMMPASEASKVPDEPQSPTQSTHRKKHQSSNMVVPVKVSKPEPTPSRSSILDSKGHSSASSRRESVSSRHLREVQLAVQEAQLEDAQIAREAASKQWWADRLAAQEAAYKSSIDSAGSQHTVDPEAAAGSVLASMNSTNIAHAGRSTAYEASAINHPNPLEPLPVGFYYEEARCLRPAAAQEEGLAHQRTQTNSTEDPFYRAYHDPAYAYDDTLVPSANELVPVDAKIHEDSQLDGQSLFEEDDEAVNKHSPPKREDFGNGGGQTFANTTVIAQTHDHNLEATADGPLVAAMISSVASLTTTSPLHHAFGNDSYLSVSSWSHPSSRDGGNQAKDHLEKEGLYYRTEDHFDQNSQSSRGDGSVGRMNPLETVPGSRTFTKGNDVETGPPISNDRWEITHNSITITWTPGDANGDNVFGCHLQMARVTAYDHRQVLCARDAFLGLHHDQQDDVNVDDEKEVEKDVEAKEAVAYVMFETMADGDDENNIVGVDNPPQSASPQTSSKSSIGQDFTFSVTAVPDNEQNKSTKLGLAGSTSTKIENKTASAAGTTAPALTSQALRWVTLDDSTRPPSEQTSRGQYGGRYLAPAVYQVTGLQPGGVYTFRVRQRNKLGWSAWSKASAMIATYPSVAPQAPMLISIHHHHVCVMWCSDITTRDSSSMPLTTLEHQLALCSVSVTSAAAIRLKSLTQDTSIGVDINKDNDDMLGNGWYLASLSRSLTSAELSNLVSSSGIASTSVGDASAASGALIEGLVAGHSYRLKVRQRTVVGWSPWSDSSEIFRTIS